MGMALAIRTDLSAEDLRALARREKNGRVVARMLALAHALEGKLRGESARLAGMDRQAFRDTVLRYNSEGLPGLYDRRSTGRPGWLTAEEKTELVAIIFDRPELNQDGCEEWTLPKLCEDVIAGKFSKTIHPSSLSRIVRKLGLSKQKARPRHPKSDEEDQEAFKKGGSIPSCLCHPTAPR
ncbi:transposase [uncultured Gammaproteobacteria bacterium]